MKRSLAWASSLLLSCVAAAAMAQSSLPRPDPHFAGQVGRTYQESDPPVFPQPPTAPEGAPNIVLIMLDDVGFGQFATFGGAIPSPALDRLASEGLRYNRFHTAGICSPTRAALLTGRNPHAAGFGHVGEMSTGYDGYTGFIPNTTATVAEVLRQHGYATAMFGKNHNTPAWEAGPAGPFNHWPNAMGFDYFYGFNGWGTSQWQPALFENTRPVPPPSDPGYQLTGDLVDRAIAWMRNVKSTSTGKPFLLYLAPGATHAPHHASREWIDRFAGHFEKGWDAYREETFAREKKLGVIPADAKLTKRPGVIRAWDDHTPQEQRVLARQMEVFAGFSAYTDHEVGRLLDAVKSLPDADNTLVIYIVGDNGASAEGGPGGEINEFAPANHVDTRHRFTPEVMAGLGGPAYNNNFANGWAWAMNTPFQYYKQIVSHLGGIRNPMVVSWPARIRDRGGLRSQFHYLSDIAPTLLQAAGVDMPDSVDGIAQKPLDGISMQYTFDDAGAPDRRRTQVFEVWGNRGLYQDGWFAAAPLQVNPADPVRGNLDPDKVAWELYDLRTDFSQADDLARRQPQKLRELQDRWWAEAARGGVLPLDWRGGERMVGVKRPGSVQDAKHFVYHPGMVALPEVIAPNVRNRSWKILARGAFSPESEGMLITQGGSIGGWAFYIHSGRPVFEYNYAGVAGYRVVASQPLPASAREVEVRFAYDGRSPKERGLGGTVTLWADGLPIGEGRIERTLPNAFTVLEGMDVGADYGSPVSDRYPFPFPFKGGLESVILDLE
ncbi:MAG: arylsulfatase [Gammaproteobacteria bacterium]